MNPMTNVKNVLKLSERELAGKNKTSWHDQYKDSAWIFIGGLPYDLTEGDVICVFSQYGEVVNLNMVRDKVTGKTRGFAFLCYEDQRSTILAVDNLNSMKILNRTIRVDHVEQYKVPNADTSKLDEMTAQIRYSGCAPQLIKREPVEPVRTEPMLPVKLESVKIEPQLQEKQKKSKKSKKEKKSKKKSKKHSRSSESSSSEDDRRSKKKKRRRSHSSDR